MTVPSSVSGNLTLSAANNPHLVTANVVVMGGATLTLEPGVIVRFNAGKVRFRCVGFKSAVLPRAELVFAQAMQVNGALIARGMASARITFTSNAVS